MKRIASAGAVILALALAGCSSISSGTITDKVHEPAHYNTSQVCHMAGKVMICTPVKTYDDEDWRFDLREGDKEGWVYVTQETFDSYDIGNYWETK